MLAMQHTRLPSRPTGTRRDGVGRGSALPVPCPLAALLTASVAAAERLHRWHRRLDLRLARRVSCDAGECRACRRDCCSARSSTSTSSIAVDWRRCAAARCRVGASRGRVARPTNSLLLRASGRHANVAKPSRQLAARRTRSRLPTSWGCAAADLR